ncbi:potassium voltage-gated channel subfamily E member 4 [Leucoraja erinacea]|uniref:potassium voltage-gated channel subfamily E member 4 n=1 Tax=Leucoraja erinaceus TaxID=7782 RepID=UPI0024558FB3|nr:potassium voltage-gated channel subfamily E member 4 [Leucoraja erinacea]
MYNSNETNLAEIRTHTAKAASDSQASEYLYILIVMSFYGFFLLGIVLCYIKSKKRQRKDDTLLLYDYRGEWAGLKSVHIPLVFSSLSDSVVPALSCAVCSLENSVDSEAALDDQLNVEEEALVGSEPLAHAHGISRPPAETHY